MGGEQGLGPQPLPVGAVFQHRPGDGHAVIGGGAPADLVQDEQGAAGGVLQQSATSFISTMKVDCPADRSSLAPMRVNTRSTTPMRAD